MLRVGLARKLRTDLKRITIPQVVVLLGPAQRTNIHTLSLSISLTLWVGITFAVEADGEDVVVIRRERELALGGVVLQINLKIK